ncbi:sensor histidine kinase [Flavobacterium sp. MC2016-06]|jgi:two-component sensor histidine kinase|uniref:tetratricopeptide repeat-containing sensor histidine kinase n=1 Tax=Flavobacterium sp. MC2016-06 TaxID=2676308 RepID=UPI0012BA77F2|nr:sensor histidine kinase [Flavobacterium sp. MC2016-06]MBU3858908.1 sensor histidine kinase [Flavobacterium sp. MC2016-06]
MKQLYFLCLMLFISCTGLAQNSSTVANYDLKKKRLLIQLCSMYLYNSNQGVIDADSSVVLACKAYKLPVSLSYDEGYNNGSYIIGSELLEKGDIDAAKLLLAKSKNTDRIKLLVQLGSFYLFKPGTKPDDLKNAELYSKEANLLSNQLKDKKWQHLSLMLLGKYYAQINNLTESKKCFEQVTNECRKENDKLALAEAIENQAVYLMPADPKKEQLLIEASRLYKQLGQEEKRIETNMNLNTIYFWGEKISQSKKLLYQSLVDMRKIGFKHEQFNETTISFIESWQFNIKSALYYALKSVRRMETTNDYTFADIFYFRLGGVYGNMYHYEEAIQMFQKSAEFGQKNINSGSWYKAFFSTVRALSLKGKNKEAIEYLNSLTVTNPPTNAFDEMILNFSLANCYWRLKNYAMAEKYFNKMAVSTELLKSPETFKDKANSLSSMAAFYANRNNTQKSKVIIDKIRLLAKSLHQNYNSIDLQIASYKIDSTNGNHLSALTHFRNYKSIEDSLLTAAKNKQIQELKIQYETAHKEQEIKQLNKESNLQETALKKSKMLNSVSIWCLVLLLITVGLLYNRYRLKQRNNVKLELKEKEISSANTNLRHLLDEKEWLLKEIHHRVKNNLQTVISLLNSQSAYLDNDMALSAIKNSQHRIHSMSLIHQKLYNSENISTINMPNYIKELVEYLKESFTLGQKIRFELKIEPLELDVAQAVPLGLILNEAITNSIKYAFPSERTGMIFITLEETADNKHLLTIADNGIGFEDDSTNKKSNSFGMTLIKGLSDDLEAKLALENNNGTILKIEFSQEFQINTKGI